MNINPTSSASVSSPVSANVAAGSVDRAATKATPKAPGNAPHADKVTISKEAQDRLNAESPLHAETPGSTEAAAVSKGGEAANGSASALDAGNDDQPGIKKFAYGVVGLERPTSEAEAKPADEYSYGRWVALAVASTAVISLLA